VLSFDPPRSATYLNGRVFTHDVIDCLVGSAL
jgi:hypothetical protein